ncbi:hypothetical protein M316_0029 [Nitrincola phage 1M3-16]|uniref:hypothetical protein n=1 Tax=Nitrincola phage 1M3-16 TaxID=1472912 RepID=UPI000444E9AC|nr:hypothetical protein GJ22_gp123 [Nitrincola phage 1M3-16]AHX01094.1 hypothetical protein M316_0029 [Nitrincola phage 1M3-16]
MNILIAGSRGFKNYKLLKRTILDWIKENYTGNIEDLCVISGRARGADRLGEHFAEEIGCNVDLYPADWEKYGGSAGYIRNAEMIKVADVAFIFWDGKSRGTKHSIDLCRKKGVPVCLVEY